MALVPSVPAEAFKDIADLRHSLDEAGEEILSAAELGMVLIQEPAPETSALNAVFVRIFQACAVHDLASQRLVRLDARLGGRPGSQTESRSEAHLLHGPASGGLGLDQDAADRLLSRDG